MPPEDRLGWPAIPRVPAADYIWRRRRARGAGGGAPGGGRTWRVRSAPDCDSGYFAPAAMSPLWKRGFPLEGVPEGARKAALGCKKICPAGCAGPDVKSAPPRPDAGPHGMQAGVDEPPAGAPRAGSRPPDPARGPDAPPGSGKNAQSARPIREMHIPDALSAFFRCIKCISRMHFPHFPSA